MNKWSYKFQRKKQELGLCWSVIIYLFDPAALCSYSLAVSAAPAVSFYHTTSTSSFFWSYKFQRKKQELGLCWSVIIYLFDPAALCSYSLAVSAAPAVPFYH